MGAREAVPTDREIAGEPGAPAAIVVTYNSAPLVGRCLATLVAGDKIPADRILVWDNASTDGSAEAAEIALPGARIIRSEANIGFAAAVNRSAKLLPGRDLLLLNPDAELEPGAIAHLAEVLAKAPGVGLVSADLIDLDGRQLTTAWRFPTPLRASYGAFAGLGRAYRPEIQPLASFLDVGDALVPFTAVLLRRSVFDRLGGLDERFWLYGEDCDYCFRVRRAGGRVAIAPSARARHIGGASSRESDRLRPQLVSEDTFRVKHFGPLAATLANTTLRLGALLRLGKERVLVPRGTEAAATGSEWRQVLHYRRPRLSPGPRSRTVVQVILTKQLAGVEKQVAELSCALREHGWRSVIVTLRGSEARLLELYEEVGDVRQVRDAPVGAIGLQLALICRRERADLLHGHMGKAMAAAVIGGRLVGRPTVTTLHFVRLRHTLRRLAGARASVFRNVIRRTAAVIAISSPVQEMAISAGLHDRARIHLVFNGVGCLGEDPPESSPVPSEPRVIYAGRMSEDKQVDLLIEAMAASGTEFELVLAGRGDQEDRLRRLAASLLPGRHRFLGFQTDIAAVIREGRLLVLPSLPEGFGLVALEAMRESRPVVGFASGGLTDIVVDGKTGFLVAPNDRDGLRRAVESLLRDLELATAMGHAGRERYLERFTADAMAQASAAVYVEVLGQQESGTTGA